MPRYFFDLYDDGVVLDREGQEFVDANEALANAIDNARELACAEVQRGALNPDHRINILDESRRPIESVTFAAASGLDKFEKEGGP